MKKVNNKKGFTLAELLVVVAILAILIAIAVPIFGSAMDKARETAINANARAIKSAAMVSIMENNTAKGANGWKAIATVDSDGSITLTSVTAATSGDTDSLPSTPTGSYTVILQETELPTT